jgi:thymidylate synthase
MEQYLDVLRKIAENGFYRNNPHDPSNISEANRALPGLKMEFDLREGFPLITCRSLAGASWRGLVYELLWYLSGSTDVGDLQKNGVHFWDSWATPQTSGTYGYIGTEVGPIYGHQWRNFGATRNHYGTYANDGFDQMANLVDELKNRPDSNRLKVITWNPFDAEEVFIAPCHGDIKCFVANGELTLTMTQRSGDVLVGVPFNIGCYALLTHMLAQVTGLKARGYIHFLTNAHIYMNHMGYVEEVLKREPKPLPQIQLNPGVSDLFGFKLEDVELLNYDPHPSIKGIPVAI